MSALRELTILLDLNKTIIRNENLPFRLGIFQDQNSTYKGFILRELQTIRWWSECWLGLNADDGIDVALWSLWDRRPTQLLIRFRDQLMMTGEVMTLNWKDNLVLECWRMGEIKLMSIIKIDKSFHFIVWKWWSLSMKLLNWSSCASNENFTITSP